MTSPPISSSSDTAPSAPAADAPVTTAGYPRRGCPVTARCAAAVLGLIGWRIVGSLPHQPRFVLIVAPHTSNWDALFCLLAMLSLDLRITFLAKHSLFRFPLGAPLRWFGGEPVDRAAGRTALDQAVARLSDAQPWVLGLAPEGTRRRVEEWKTGFYRIALAAAVPIVPVSLDYSTRSLRIQPLVTPMATVDPAEGVLAIRQGFHARMARKPSHFAELPPSGTT